MKKLPGYLSVVFLLTSCTASFVCGQGPEQDIPTVLTAPSVVLEDAEARRFAGSVVAVEEVDVVPRVTGNIEKINFKEGDYVKQGDILFQIEDREYKANLTSAKVQVAVCQAQILQFQAAIVQQEARIVELDALIKYKTLNYNRNKELHERGNAVSEDLVDSSESELKATKAQKDAALASIDATKAQLDAAKASLDAAKAKLDLAEFDMEHTKITALISGKIGKVTVTKGNLVTPQSGKLADIKMISPIYVRFSISERLYRSTYGGEAGIQSTARVKLELADDSIYPEEAKIALTDNKVDPHTNTIMIWGILQNNDRKLYPGSYATVMLSPKRDKPQVGALLSAIQTDGKGSYLYIVDSEMKVARRDVRLGTICGNYYEITAGLNVGELVVVDGTNKIKPGSKIVSVPYQDEDQAATTPSTPVKSEAKESPTAEKAAPSTSTPSKPAASPEEKR